MSKPHSLKKTRVDFISDLLQSRKLGAGEKERVFSLVAREIDFMESKGDFIISEIEAIKAQLDVVVPEQIVSTVAKEEKVDLPELVIENYKNPENNGNFLKELNQDPVLKSLTHNTDTNQLLSINDALGLSQYDFETHLKEIRRRYQVLANKYFYKLSKGLWDKVFQYIHGHKTWSEDKIKTSWSSPDLLKWAKEHPGCSPNPTIDVSTEMFKFPLITTKNGDPINTMPALVLFFKAQVTVRFDNNLYDLVDGWNIHFAGRVKFNLDKLKSKIEFFTDVEKLHQAYRHLIQLCIDCHPNELPDIVLGVEMSEEKKVVFSIWQTNAVCKRTKEDLLTRYGATFTGLIKNQLNGLCDWTLDADFGDGDYSSISIWPRKAESRPIEKMIGLRYNLIFS
ncbi:hypothetical protein [Pedobacter aquatilis]|uniref:hypothetical protein n=1 Tax=Pedobacter aquatilis TaxID=351343 RepID=UPI0029312837|nr:hypothetical protein [Pedobacter aquatilis]